MTTATATPRKVRETTYFTMTGTAEGARMVLTKPTKKALEDAFDVLAVLAKSDGIFPKAPALLKGISQFLDDPTAKPDDQAAGGERKSA